jgi:hypothetical protein
MKRDQNKTSSKKLTVNKETIRELQFDEPRVSGGATNVACPPVFSQRNCFPTARDCC